VPWPPAGQTGCGCCGVAVGEGAPFASIQKAIDSLPVTGGEVSILPGRYFEYVALKGRTDVVIRGCGPQTRIASPALQIDGSSGAKPAATASGLNAVVELLGSRHVQLRELCIEAADGECGVLLDYPPEDTQILRVESASNTDICLASLSITASTLPGILVNEAELVEAVSNRIAMKDVFSEWPGVYLSGVELRFLRNWVGLQNASAEWLPGEMGQDLGDNAAAMSVGLAKKGLSAPGGVQIAGASKDVFVVENEIEGGGGNGVALGSVRLLDVNGGDTGILVGVVMTPEDDCATTVSNQIPKTIAGGDYTVVAGARLINVTVARNRIRNMGLCGVGPVGFFDLATALEVVSMENLTIAGNAIERSLNWPLADNALGYGAICAPDVKGLRIFDNAITDFGATPGAAHAWGIFVLFGELVEISRNRVIETRDWALASSDEKEEASGRGGIVIAGVAPPSLVSTASYDSSAPGASTLAAGNYVAAAVAPMFEPGLPALRIENNVVRVASGPALEAVGLGPFSTLGNQFATCGPMRISGSALATTVVLLNLGKAIEFDQAFNKYGDLYATKQASASRLGATALAASTNGTVLFANNVCQLEARASGEKGFSSVLVATFDHALFANNLCWVDGPRGELLLPVDAAVLALTVQATSNRFQESPTSVLASALTYGLMNVTSLNMSTFNVLAVAGDASKLGPVDNISWI
jgi:hypothetical protein